MSNSFVSLEGKSRNYRLAVAILAAITLIGLICFAISYVLGHQMFGTSNVVPWGLPIVLAIYLIGLSAGSLILSSLTYVFGREEYRPIARMAVLLAIVLILGAMISIAVDLGRPEKFWRLFMFFYMNNMTSMFAINGILYGGYFVISTLYLGIIMSNNKKLSKIMGIVAVFWAVLVHMGTGAIFGLIAAREAWFSAVRPFEFLAAAVTSGLALLIVVTLLTLRFSGRSVKKDLIKSLSSMLKIFIIILVILIAMDKLTHLYEPARGAALFMLGGPYSWVFWIFQIGLVVIVPLAILFNPRLNKSIKWIAIASTSVVIGIFFERYYLVIPGAAYPQQYYPGNIEGVYGAVGHFAFTPAEVGLSIGIFALVALVFFLGLKYLEVLPPKEAKEVPAPVEVLSSDASAAPEPSATAENSASPVTDTPSETDAPSGSE